MKVREEPVTPWTIEMLPASRLESCARNSVGRRSLISLSLRKSSCLPALRQAAENGAVGGKIALAAAGGHDHVHAAEQLRIALGPGAVEREAGGVGADPLPRLHLPLVALLRDLGVEIHRRQRMDDVGREGRALDIGLAGIERLPMGVRPLAEAGYDADAGDPGLAAAFQPCADASTGNPMRCATSLMLVRNFGSGKAMTRKVISRVGHGLAVHIDGRLGYRIAGTVMQQACPQRQHLSGGDECPQFCFLHRRQERHAREAGDADDQPARGLRHRFDEKHAGHQRMAGEMPLEDRAGFGNLRLRRDGAAHQIELDDPIDELEIFEPHGGPATPPSPRPDRRCWCRDCRGRNTARSWPCRH